ncbi:hypothetical protein C0995_001279, partial [Termitomyces sp. Mi166
PIFTASACVQNNSYGMPGIQHISQAKFTKNIESRIGDVAPSSAHAKLLLMKPAKDKVENVPIPMILSKYSSASDSSISSSALSLLDNPSGL